MCESFPTLSPKPDPPGWDSECPRFVCPKCDLLVVRRVDSIILDGFGSSGWGLRFQVSTESLSSLDISECLKADDWF